MFIRSLLTLAVLFPMSANADPAPPTAANDPLEDARARIREPFLKAQLPPMQVKQTLTRISNQPPEPDAPPEAAEQRKKDAEKLLKTVDEIRNLVTAPPPWPQVPTAPIEQSVVEGLARRVNDISEAIKLEDPKQRSDALELYLTRWQTGRTDMTAEKIAAQREQSKTELKKGIAQQNAANQRAKGLLNANAFGGQNGPGGVPVNGAAAASVGKGQVANLGGASGTAGPQGLDKGQVPSPINEADPCAKGESGFARLTNQEKCSVKGTPNVESEAGTKAKICGLMKSSNYSTSEAWGRSLAARKAPGADPGDLDLRNAEHYLYAAQTTEKPSGIGDSVPVQLVLAVGWTPFKTATKYFRPTSTPSVDEMKWGVKGAMEGVGTPTNWAKECADPS